MDYGLIRLIGGFAIGLLMAVCCVAADQKDKLPLYEVRVPGQYPGPNPYHDYYPTLLKMALEESKLAGETIRLEQLKQNYPQARLIYETQFQGANQPPLVIWTATSRDREKVLRPIRIPLVKGLLGKRVFLIRKNEQARFDGVESLQDLAKLRAGQARDWPDTGILRANGLPVTTASDTNLLHRMLQGRRFDYFPRSITEAWHELATHSTQGLAVEQGLMLSYPFANYFFVNNSHGDLARRIETGLKALIADGRFDRYFLNHPRNKKALQEIQSRPRRVFDLENPQLPSETPLEAEHLWYQLPFETKE